MERSAFDGPLFPRGYRRRQTPGNEQTGQGGANGPEPLTAVK